MTKWKVLLAAGALSLAASLPAAAATLNVVNNQLIGASGVTVATAAGTKTYNVEFLDGSCVSLFSNCAADPAASGLPAFAFTTATDALAASQALLDQVFTGIYDTEPQRTRGCTVDFCNALTPYQVAIVTGATATVAIAFSQNETSIIFDNVGSITTSISDDFESNGALTYARWSEVTPIPLPAGMPLVLSGLAALAGLRWRKRHERRRVQV